MITLRIGRWARWITEYYPCENVVRGDGECWTVQMRVSDLAWARRLVLGLGSEAVVLAPEELAAEVREEVDRTLMTYGA